MHELSIAQALFDLAYDRTPVDAIVRAVHVRAGPLRGIDPDAMRWAWQSVTAGHALADSELDLQLLPWSLHCPDCNTEFTSHDPLVRCACGSDRAHPVGGDELVLLSIEIDDEVPHASASH